MLRGFAVLGILLMNIQSFAMIDMAYMNPTAYGDLSGANFAVWLSCHLLADMKFITIFSMLFGAGVVIMTSRREAATGRSAAVHYRRMLWLLLFGLAHAYLLWYGDILYTYAMCGFLVYLFRHWKPRSLIVTGLCVVAVGSAIALLFHFGQSKMPADQIADLRLEWRPDGDKVTEALLTYRGGWLQQLPKRFESALFFQTFIFLIAMCWRAGGMMLVGMGLYKLGVFSAERSNRFYLMLAAVGALVGLPIVSAGAYRNFSTGWQFETSFFLGDQFNYWGSILVCLGWVGLIMFICREGSLRRVTRTLAAAGQMAFTNYILQTVICTTLFYGHGFGLFGRVERIGQLGVVLAVWAFELALSVIWLKYFRFGPLEWLWRTLTYWKLQPMRRTA